VSRSEHPSASIALTHPDPIRYRFSKLPGHLGDKCRCGGILYDHAAREAGGCDFCPCPEFDPMEGEIDGI
jgi:hypothetical protein